MNAMNAALFFLSLGPKEERDITNMKLQKLLYFAQGLSLALFNKPLFADEIQAWKYGPVAPVVDEAMRKFGEQVIPQPRRFNPAVIDEETRQFLTDIFAVYGRFSSGELSKITHREGPWKAKLKHYQEITQDDLRAYFITKSEAFVEEVELIEDSDLVREFTPSPDSELITHDDLWKRLRN